MANTLLNYDTQGFIVGLRRVEQQTKGVQRDTSRIVQILTEQRRQIERQFQQQQRQSAGQRRNRLENSVQQRTNRQSERQQIERQQRQAERRQQRESQRVARQQVERQRDEQGRFSRQAEAKEQNSQLSQMLAEQFNNVLQQNADGLDPVLDSLNEVRDMFSPLANGLGMMWKGGMWSAQKLMKFRRQEPRSREERTHDDAVEEQLENIARNTQNASGGGGLFGRLFGRNGLFAGGVLGALATGFAKFFKSKGFLGAILGAGGLALNWDKLSFEEKGKGIGRVGGMVAGGLAGAAAGSVLGPIGTIIGGLAGAYFGGDAGETLAKVAIPQIQSWTTQLKNYNLAGKIKGLWDNVTTKISNAFSSVPDHVKAAFDGAIEFIKNGFGKGLEAGKGLWGSFKDTAKNFISGLPGGQAVLDMVGAGTASSGAESMPTGTGKRKIVKDGSGKDLELGEIQTKNGLKAWVDAKAVGQFQGFINDLEATGYVIKDLHGFVDRDNRNAKGVKSKHAFGQAIDINPATNPNFKGVSQAERAKNPRKYTDMPIEKVRELRQKWGLGWGYDWKTISDAMHFSVATNEGGRYLSSLGGGRATTATTTVPATGGKVSTKAAAGIFNPYFHRNIDTILSVYNQMGVPKNIQAGLLAQISAESGFNHNAVSPKEAFGVSQFMPGTAKRFGVQRGDVASQARGQVKYMQYLMKNFTKGNWNGALQAYNAGEGNYQKYRGNIPFAETRGYVQKINERTPIFQKYLDSRTGTPTATPTVTPPKPPAVKAPTTKPPQSPPKIEIGKRTGTERIITSQNTPQQITQNISDRNLAHAITGGLGMDRYAV